MTCQPGIQHLGFLLGDLAGYFQVFCKRPICKRPIYVCPGPAHWHRAGLRRRHQHHGPWRPMPRGRPAGLAPPRRVRRPRGRQGALAQRREAAGAPQDLPEWPGRGRHRGGPRAGAGAGAADRRERARHVLRAWAAHRPAVRPRARVPGRRGRPAARDGARRRERRCGLRRGRREPRRPEVRLPLQRGDRGARRRRQARPSSRRARAWRDRRAQRLQEGGRVLLTEILLPRIAGRRTACPL